MRSFYGDTLSVSYTQNGVVSSTSANYYTTLTNTNFGANVGYNTLGTFSDYDVLVYTINWASGSYLVNDIEISGLETYFPDHYRMGVALTSYNNNITAAYNEFVVNTNHWSTFQAVTGNYEASSNLINYFGMLYPPQIQGYTPVARPIFISGTEGGYFDTVYFNSIACNSYGGGGRSWLYIFCPYVGSSMSSSPPVETTTAVTTTDNSAGTTVVVDVDMTETNSLLGQIKQAILGIVEGITNALKDLFIPDEEFLDDFKEDMLGTDQESGFLEEHLGGLYQAIEAIGRIFDEFPDAVAATSIDIPACQIPLAGETLTLGPYSVPLIVEGLPQIFYDGLKFIIDFLCVAAFLNMCRNKLEIFLNPDSEVVQNDS